MQRFLPVWTRARPTAPANAASRNRARIRAGELTGADARIVRSRASDQGSVSQPRLCRPVRTTSLANRQARRAGRSLVVRIGPRKPLALSRAPSSAKDWPGCSGWDIPAGQAHRLCHFGRFAGVLAMRACEHSRLDNVVDGVLASILATEPLHRLLVGIAAGFCHSERLQSEAAA
ncbi:MAG: hypothetical protein MZV70_04915 [Desulfobacterales bacterium]|nr:hypothetical protein [Desulfobacterales bacterium]